MLKEVKKQIKNFIIYLISFCINYLVFVIGMFFINENNVIGINVVNLIAWIMSMLFIFYIDKKYVPDLVDENNINELFEFILIRIFSLIIEAVVIYIFIIILKNNYYFVKLASLLILFAFNNFYVKHIQLK